MSHYQHPLRVQDMNICPPLNEVSKNVVNDRKRPASRDHTKLAFSESKLSITTLGLQRPEQAFQQPDVRFNYDTLQAKNMDAYADFAFDVFCYLKHKEMSYQLSNYVRHTNLVPENCRAVTVDWLVEFHEMYDYFNETLYLAVRLFDTFLAAHPNTLLDHFQLVAATSLLVASKYEEYTPPTISNLLDLCDGAYTKKDVLTMEMAILRTADYKLGFPVSYSFLRRYAQVSGADVRTLTLARFFLELSLHYSDFAITERPSKLAAAVLVLAFRSRHQAFDWTQRLTYYSGYPIDDIEVLVDRLDRAIVQFKQTFPKCNLTVVKYSDANLYEVAKDVFDS